MSIYDKEYLQHYTGLKPLQLYSFSGFYTAGHEYAPNRPEILLFGHNLEQLNYSNLKNIKIVSVRKLYPRYELSDLMNHRAAVYVAYSVMSYKFTELYSLALPLFMPSMKFYKNIRGFGNDRLFLHKDLKPHPSSIHPYSPNVAKEEDEESEYYWLQFSDFYQMPHVTYFDDFQDLEVKLNKADYNHIHKLMVAENKKRRRILLDNWRQATKVIQKGRTVPQHYTQAIEKLYNSRQLQVI